MQKPLEQYYFFEGPASGGSLFLRFSTPRSAGGLLLRSPLVSKWNIAPCSFNNKNSISKWPKRLNPHYNSHLS